MIIGIGTDIVNIARLKASQEAFAARILTPKEREKMAALPAYKQLAHLAKRFAAKEALAKALGCGIGKKLAFQEIEISHDAAGKPLLSCPRYPQYCYHLSLSDEREYATAMVVVTQVD